MQPTPNPTHNNDKFYNICVKEDVFHEFGIVKHKLRFRTNTDVLRYILSQVIA